MVREQFARQSAGGMIRASIFGSCRMSLVDFNLLSVIGTRDYLRCTNDRETAAAVLPACRKIFQWFDAHTTPDGLIDSAWQAMQTWPEWEHRYDPDSDHSPPWAENLFIDHPGLGWHNVGEPGIDRRGINAALNALYLTAQRALADLEAILNGKPPAADDSRLRAVLHQTFFDAESGAYRDGVFEGTRLPQINQLTNVWAIQAGLCPPHERAAIVQRILRDDDAIIARCGPYFYLYFFPLMVELNMHRRALELTRNLWGRMIDGARPRCGRHSQATN